MMDSLAKYYTVVLHSPNDMFLSAVEQVDLRSSIDSFLHNYVYLARAHMEAGHPPLLLVGFSVDSQTG